MTIDNVRLPEDIERGARGGPEFNTTIAELSSGFEARNQNWRYARYTWNVGYGIQDSEGYMRVLRFHLARRGKARAFRFKDWSDYEVVNGGIAVADGIKTSYQLVKVYADDVLPYTRFISKPVDNTVSVTQDGIIVDSALYAVDLNAGLVVFGVAPAFGTVLRWSGEFDMPVRFDNDIMELNLDWIEAGGIPSIIVKEIRE